MSDEQPKGQGEDQPEPSKFATAFALTTKDVGAIVPVDYGVGDD